MVPAVKSAQELLVKHDDIVLSFGSILHWDSNNSSTSRRGPASSRSSVVLRLEVTLPGSACHFEM